MTKHKLISCKIISHLTERKLKGASVEALQAEFLPPTKPSRCRISERKLDSSPSVGSTSASPLEQLFGTKPIYKPATTPETSRVFGKKHTPQLERTAPIPKPSTQLAAVFGIIK